MKWKEFGLSFSVSIIKRNKVLPAFLSSPFIPIPLSQRFLWPSEVSSNLNAAPSMQFNVLVIVESCLQINSR